MSDLTKILLSACLGMLTGLAGGLVLEPLKDFVKTMLKAGQARRGILREIAGLRDLFQSAMHQENEFNMTLLPRVTFDAFDFYYAQHRDAFYKIKHCEDILGLYREMKLIQTQVVKKEMAPQLAARDLCNAIDCRIDAGIFTEQALKEEIEIVRTNGAKYKQPASQYLFDKPKIY